MSLRFPLLREILCGVARKLPKMEARKKKEKQISEDDAVGAANAGLR
jgi:hypothetical protein